MWPGRLTHCQARPKTSAARPLAPQQDDRRAPRPASSRCASASSPSPSRRWAPASSAPRPRSRNPRRSSR
ncbi:hypothetical protein CTI14_30360, partial [Methylobacterium radiotolerans]